MTPRASCQATVTLFCLGVAVAASLLLAAVVARLAMPSGSGRLWVWLAVTLALFAGAVAASVWVYRAVGRQWDRTATPDLPPSGGTPIDGPAGPTPERLNS